MVTNASVVPENLFMKPELQEFIQILTEIGQQFVELSKTLKSEVHLKNTCNSKICNVGSEERF